MQPVPPQWFKLRQGKIEPAGTDTYRLSAPQQQEAFISVQQAENGRWSASLRMTADGPAVAATEPVLENAGDAWQAAFELYREHVII